MSNYPTSTGSPNLDCVLYCSNAQANWNEVGTLLHPTGQGGSLAEDAYVGANLAAAQTVYLGTVRPLYGMVAVANNVNALATGNTNNLMPLTAPIPFLLQYQNPTQALVGPATLSVVTAGAGAVAGSLAATVELPVLVIGLNDGASTALPLFSTAWVPATTDNAAGSCGKCRSQQYCFCGGSGD